MSQLDLFGAPVEAKESTEKSAKKPRSARKPRAKQLDGSCGAYGVANQAENVARDDDLIAADVDLDDRCFVIGCGCVATGREIDGHPVCGLHDTPETRAVMAAGSWPAWYGYAGKWSIVATVRRLDDLGHTWVGTITAAKSCSTCGLGYPQWQRNRFETACKNYQQPDTTKGLFRP